jgi:lipopolysaccharide transport system ATP-binding protein
LSTVIKVENISKQYRLGEVGTGSLSHDLNRWLHKIRGKENPYLQIGEINDRAVKGDSDYVWALKDINFEVQQGEVLGIIGRNGAGKSTLLKILSKTTTPTTGSIKIKGRIASLLEVGTGFHPELTGRDNIFLNGAILGMTKKEIKSKFDEIVDFAGVERYIDTPVKRYSSGMYVRLAFGVAAHLEPEILIVDEVLAVGDAEFQKKALGKMKDVSEKGGRTVLFVSHNMEAVSTICNQGLMLENGRVKIIGNISKVTENYLSSDISNSYFYKGEGAIIEARMCSDKNYLEYGYPLIVEVVFKTLEPIVNLVIGLVIKDLHGINYLAVNNKHYHNEKINTFPVKEGRVKIAIPKFSLMPGKYKLDLHLGDSLVDIQVVENIFSFDIQESRITSTFASLDYRLNKIFIENISFNLNDFK